ncbi:F-box/kelch-repeat protein At2g24250-like [Carex rostrata]
MDWSDLPSELVITIAGNLTEFTDHLRFRSVCSHWRSSFQSHSLSLPRQLPWLALPSTSSPHFYSFSEDRVYSSPPAVVANNTNVLGSASGWFISVRGRDRHITFSLINPFTGVSIGLPSPDPYSSLFYAAADTLVWDRSDSAVVAACSTRLGVFHCRLGETAWVLIESQHYHMASSITFYEGRFYILQDDTCETVVLDGETLQQITVIDAPHLDSPVEAHLFVSSGELLLLMKSTWMYLFPDSDSQFYKVRRANLNDELVEWIEVNDIGDRALFVDNLHCFSVEVGDHSLLRRNCIYSAQSKTSGGPRNSSRTYSISIFDLKNNNGERLGCALNKFCAASLRGVVSPPSWILPSLS